MPRAAKVCSTPGCPNIAPPGQSRCVDPCQRQAERERGTAHERGYGGKHWRIRRRATLRRDPLCTCTDHTCGHGPHCLAPSTVADHYPRSRRELLAAGVPDPDAVDLLRGVCKRCHDHSTATTPGQQGGWNRRT